jgi:hypothetical protein
MKMAPVPTLSVTFSMEGTSYDLSKLTIEKRKELLKISHNAKSEIIEQIFEAIPNLVVNEAAAPHDDDNISDFTISIIAKDSFFRVSAKTWNGSDWHEALFQILFHPHVSEIKINNIHALNAGREGGSLFFSYLAQAIKIATLSALEKVYITKSVLFDTDGTHLFLSALKDLPKLTEFNFVGSVFQASYFNDGESCLHFLQDVLSNPNITTLRFFNYSLFTSYQSSRFTFKSLSGNPVTFIFEDLGHLYKRARFNYDLHKGGEDTIKYFIKASIEKYMLSGYNIRDINYLDSSIPIDEERAFLSNFVLEWPSHITEKILREYLEEIKFVSKLVKSILIGAVDISDIPTDIVDACRAYALPRKVSQYRFAIEYPIGVSDQVDAGKIFFDDLKESRDIFIAKNILPVDFDNDSFTFFGEPNETSEFEIRFAEILNKAFLFRRSPLSAAADLFSLVVLFSNHDTEGNPAPYLVIKPNLASNQDIARFFSIASQLPLELQMVLCLRVFQLAKTIILAKTAEPFYKKNLAPEPKARPTFRFL